MNKYVWKHAEAQYSMAGWWRWHEHEQNITAPKLALIRTLNCVNRWLILIL